MACILKLARGIAGVSDSRGQVLSFKSALIDALSGDRKLRGRPLPKPDADAIAGAVALDLTARGYNEASIRVKKSQALLLATCAPVLPMAFERKDLAPIRDTLAGLLKFCTRLRKSEYKVDRAAREFNQAHRPDPVKSAVIHIKSVLGMTSKHRFASAKAKAALVEWAGQFGLSLPQKMIDEYS